MMINKVLEGAAEESFIAGGIPGSVEGTGCKERTGEVETGRISWFNM